MTIDMLAWRTRFSKTRRERPGAVAEVARTLCAKNESFQANST
jgi:hypothetical protein